MQTKKVFSVTLLMFCLVFGHAPISLAGAFQGSEITPKSVVTKARKTELLKIFETAGITGAEAVQRLILSETMAGHCPAIEDGNQKVIELVMQGIAKVMRNRLKERSSNSELALVFAANQFNSSVAAYSCSEIEGFLDPKSFEGRVKGLSATKLWTMAGRAYDKAWLQPAFTHDNRKVRNYYLHQHFRRGQCRFKAPAWVQGSAEIPLFVDGPKTEAEPLDQIVRECIGFYLLK